MPDDDDAACADDSLPFDDDRSKIRFDAGADNGRPKLIDLVNRLVGILAAAAACAAASVPRAMGLVGAGGGRGAAEPAPEERAERADAGRRRLCVVLVVLWSWRAECGRVCMEGDGARDVWGDSCLCVG